MPRAPKKVDAPLAPLALAPANLYCGTSGWDYPTWKPGFYPADVPRRAFLSYYAANLNSTEVNYTFRSVLTPEIAAKWLAATPEGFLFSVKAPQQITHFTRLRDCDSHLADFLATLTPLRSAGRLGVVLFQLPPNFKANPALLRAFLASAPLRTDAPRIALEFRNEGWFTEDTYAALRDHNAALCIAETADLITPEVQTADFSVYRLRRPGGYPSKQLANFASTLPALAAGRPTFAYLMHEDEPIGALNARAILNKANKLAGGVQA